MKFHVDVLCVNESGVEARCEMIEIVRCELTMETLELSLEALERVQTVVLDLDLMRNHSVSAEKLAADVAEFETHVQNNQGSIPNYGERYRQGETISTAFVESTINHVVSRRFVKKQQMHWTQRVAHLLPQTRTTVLNKSLFIIFWWMF